MDKYRILFLALLLAISSPALAEENLNSNTATNTLRKNSSAITLSVGEYSELVPEETAGTWIKSSNVFSLSPASKSEFENTSYCPVDDIFCALILTDTQRQYIRLSQQIILDVGSIQLYIEDLARRVNRDPTDAKFQITEGKVTAFSEAQEGISLNVQDSTATIYDTLNSNPVGSSLKINLSFDTKKPEINYGDVNDLGIKSLIGEGTSNFKGSPKNRIHNVKVGAERFNGLLIKPGEEFSFVKNLGPVDADHGYLPELVIKKNVTEPEFGGGICQVSTTAFRAAIYSGLKITARKNHAYPVSYYNPQGMDATVYVPSPDLRFINNTPGYILIQTKVEGTVLTFDFYGTDDGRKTTINGPRVIEKQPDGAMKTTFTQHVFDISGKEIIKDVFNSSYDSPYKYPHPGGPVLNAKPANWSKDQWKAYQKMQKEIANAAAKNN
jgi:vancomycin resistance protein YoaR